MALAEKGLDPTYDVVAESIALVQAATQSGVRMRWDYSYEDPHVRCAWVPSRRPASRYR